MAEGTLGWRKPADREYLQKWALTPETIPSKAHPAALGIYWYSSFDNPVKYGDRYWIGRNKKLGYVRGGHCICVQPGDALDWWLWYDWYNQGNEGACVGFALSRCMSLMNRSTYDANWLYKQAQLADEWDDTPPEEGTSTNAGCDVLITQGHVRVRMSDKKEFPPNTASGIAAYRWATSVDDIHAVLKNSVADKLGAIPLLNSWGRDYPHKVWMPDEIVDRVVFDEGGECAILTDR